MSIKASCAEPCFCHAAPVLRACFPLLGLLLMPGMPSLGAAPAYYTVKDTPKAQAEARSRNLPIAWLASEPKALSVFMPPLGSSGDLTQMAMQNLDGGAVIVFLDDQDTASMPDLVLSELSIHDDGFLNGHTAWARPKIILTDTEITKSLARVSASQLEASGSEAINLPLLHIHHDAAVLKPEVPLFSGGGMNLVANTLFFLGRYGIYLGLGLLAALVGAGVLAAKGQRT